MRPIYHKLKRDYVMTNYKPYNLEKIYECICGYKNTQLNEAVKHIKDNYTDEQLKELEAAKEAFRLRNKGVKNDN